MINSVASCKVQVWGNGHGNAGASSVGVNVVVKWAKKKGSPLVVRANERNAHNARFPYPDDEPKRVLHVARGQSMWNGEGQTKSRKT